MEAKPLEVVSGCGLDHQGRGCRVGGETGLRQCSEERNLHVRVGNGGGVFFSIKHFLVTTGQTASHGQRLAPSLRSLADCLLCFPPLFGQFVGSLGLGG